MTKLILSCVSLALVATATPALAGDANGKGEKLICRDVELTGSRVPRKVCRTFEQWKSVMEEEPRHSGKAKRDAARDNTADSRAS